MASPNRNSQEKESTSGSYAESSQPTEVKSSGGTTIEYPLRAKFTWRIEDFSRLNVEKVYSSVFQLGYSNWRILMFPWGNGANFLSLYLDVEVADFSTLLYDWRIYAEFKLAVVNQLDCSLTYQKVSTHEFNAKESDWGIQKFMPLEEFYNPYLGYLVNNVCLIEVELVAYGVMDHWLRDSNKEIQFVGLKNQGATCYLNSLLQTLYHIPNFRKVVYNMPTNCNDELSNSIPLALQRLFYELQYNEGSVATNELTRSFGWGPSDVSVQQDVQEMNRLLCRTLELFMEGTVVESSIKDLFEGHHQYYIECINVDSKSSEKESFYDLQLDVKGCRDVYASLDKFVAVEHLHGDNKYDAKNHGLQDARKRVLFVNFPPVLQLQLKRFEYDFVQGIMVKINDRYEFPLQLDLDRDNGKYLSPKADRSVRNLYALHSVVVHTGGAHGGHYYAFIRPDLSSQWYKFNDEQVTREDMDMTIEELYGGEESNHGITYIRNSNAYMLVYIRESDKEKILCDVDEKDIAMPLREMLMKELGEKKQKAEEDAYTIVKVATDDDISKQIGNNTYFDLLDFEKVRSLRVWKSMPFNIFQEEVAKDIGLPMNFLRYWVWVERINGSCRPLSPLTFQEEALTVGQLQELWGICGLLKIFLEVERGPDLCPMHLPVITADDILLFFKFYDPEKETLRYAGRLFVNHFAKPIYILAKLNELVGFAPNENIKLFEEITHKPNVICKPIDKELSFRSNQVGNGDIVCFQKSISPQFKEQLCLPDVPTFLTHWHKIQEDLQKFGYRCNSNISGPKQSVCNMNLIRSRL